MCKKYKKNIFISFALFIFLFKTAINSQFTLDIENLNYFECLDILSESNILQTKLEIQNIFKLENNLQSNHINENINRYNKMKNNSYFKYIFNNTKNSESSLSARSMKNQNYLKLKNFTIEKNFQIFLKIKKNPDLIDREIDDLNKDRKLKLHNIPKNGLYIWLMRNNKFNFEAIKKNIEFNGLTFKISDTDIKFISSNKEKTTILKPFFDMNNEYKIQTKEKIIKSNLDEEIIKITSVNNLLFVEVFNSTKDKWEVAFFDNFIFQTIENYGINIEIISEIKDNSESYSIEYLSICPIKSLNTRKEYKIEDENKEISNNLKASINTEIEEKGNINYETNINITEHLEESGNNILNFFYDEKEKEKFKNTIDDIFNNIKNIKLQIKNISSKDNENLTNEKLDNSHKNLNENIENNFVWLFDSINEILQDKNSTLYNIDKYNYTNKIDDFKINIENLRNFSNNLIYDFIKEDKLNKNQSFSTEENFNLMKTNFIRLNKNLKLIITESDREIKTILNELLNNQNSISISFLEYLIFIVIFLMLFLLYLVYRLVNLNLEIPKDYLKLSSEIIHLEKNNSN